MVKLGKGKKAASEGAWPLPPITTITPIWARVLATREESVWMSGQGVDCLLVALDYLYSPSFDSIVFDSGFVIPLPTELTKLPAQSYLSFDAAIVGFSSRTPMMQAVKRVALVQGEERSFVTRSIQEADDLFNPPRRLMWTRQLVLSRTVAELEKQQIKQQQEQRALEERRKRALVALNEADEPATDQMLFEELLVQRGPPRPPRPRLTRDVDDEY